MPFVFGTGTQISRINVAMLVHERVAEWIVLGAAAAAVTSTTMLRLSSFQSVLDAKPNEPPVCTRTLSLKTARRRNGDIDPGPNAFQNLALEAQNSRLHVKNPTYSLHCN